jgi:hypothetical protein
MFYLVALMKALEIEHELPNALEWSVRAKERFNQLNSIYPFCIDIGTHPRIEEGLRVLSEANTIVKKIIQRDGFLYLVSRNRDEKYDELKESLRKLPELARDFRESFSTLHELFNLQVRHLQDHFVASTSPLPLELGEVCTALLILSEGLSVVEVKCHIFNGRIFPTDVYDRHYIVVDRGYQLALPLPDPNSSPTVWPFIIPEKTIGKIMDGRVIPLEIVEIRLRPTTRTYAR